MAEATHRPATATVPIAPAPEVPLDASVALWRGGGDLEVAAAAIPEVGPGEVLVEMACATVCGCVRRVMEERRFGGAPTILGHEGVGAVVATGGPVLDVDGYAIAVGDRLVWLARTSCGECRRCRAGDTASCAGAREVGSEPVTQAAPLSGAFATHAVLPSGAALARIPSWGPDALLSPAGCAIARAAAAVDRVGPVAGLRVTVVGAGLIGLAALALASEQGAASCVAVEPQASRRLRAQEFGADLAIDPAARMPASDAVIVTCGSGSALTSGLGMLARGGSMVLLGPLDGGQSALDGARMAREGLSVRGVVGPEPRHLAHAVELLVSTHAVRPWAALIGAPVPLERTAAAVLAGDATDLRGAIVPARRVES
ncbi:alcohol dehydrogenase catalytic domain-containing protein [Demequina sp. NBRC 110053]|uniref:alcohol dehydrogenase catalytic domain-containing protein n=1 Tax=Demequina sp. NBRC 110053 TaxID=1570342 RepID=UPI000A033580|nr:alcohol dehydrogenase catalytic domain-containing protein [Demequina sp. NBRC 110053]